MKNWEHVLCHRFRMRGTREADAFTRVTIWNSEDDASSESDSARRASRCTTAILLADMRLSTAAASKHGSHSLRRQADSLSQSRSKSRHAVAQQCFGDINFSDLDGVKPRKTEIEQNRPGGHVWQCKCLSPSCYEKQTNTPRLQPSIHLHNNSPL